MRARLDPTNRTGAFRNGGTLPNRTHSLGLPLPQAEALRSVKELAMWKLLVLLTVVALVGGLGFLIDAQSRAEVRYAEPPSLGQSIFALGRVEGLTPEIEMRTQLMGRVDGILVEEGQRVEKGDVLLQLDDEQYRSAVAQAEAELALAQAQLERLQTGARSQEREEAAAWHRAKLAELERAQLAWKRISELVASKAASQQDADNQRTALAAVQAEAEAAKAKWELLEAPPREDEVRMAQARIEAAKAQLANARAELSRMQLRAPVTGQILKIDIDLGELTGPESLNPPIIMADTRKFRVRAFVEELDAPAVRPSLSARVAADGLPGKQFAGHVVRFSPYMSRKELWSDDPAERYDTKTREVWIELDDAEDLVVGLRVDVMIDVPQSRDADDKT